MVNAAHSCSLAGILVFEERMTVWSASGVGKDRKISSCGRAAPTTTSTESVRAKSHPNRTNLWGAGSGSGCSRRCGHHIRHHSGAMADAPRFASMKRTLGRVSPHFFPRGRWRTREGKRREGRIGNSNQRSGRRMTRAAGSDILASATGGPEEERQR
ncbi:Os05g0290400, partial [Oryza sativa Japonica Group]